MCSTLQHSATLQHTATRCNTWHHAATRDIKQIKAFQKNEHISTAENTVSSCMDFFGQIEKGIWRGGEGGEGGC